MIGFDTLASIEIDSQFGEVDIQNMPFDTSFEIRVGQININSWDCGPNLITPNNDLITYMSKIDIASRNCDSWDFTQTINGLPPFSTLFIRNKDLPVTINWDSTLFENDCLGGSIITDLHPGGWFDASCSAESITLINLENQASLVVNNPSGIFMIDSFGDTLSMFHVALSVMDFLDDVPILPNQTLELYPNPTGRLVNIKSEQFKISQVEVYNSKGQLVIKRANSQIIDLQNFPNGLYFIRLEIDGQFLTKKIKKNSQ